VDKNVICCEQCEREYHVGCVCKLQADLKRSALHVIEKAKGLCASSRREEGTGHRRRRRPPPTDMAGGGGLDWRMDWRIAGARGGDRQQQRLRRGAFTYRTGGPPVTVYRAAVTEQIQIFKSTAKSIGNRSVYHSVRIGNRSVRPVNRG
jgi:hypothetical protein